MLIGTIFGLDNNEKWKRKLIPHADAYAIGSGAAGAIIAQRLANTTPKNSGDHRTKSVVLLEKGGYYDAEDMNQRESELLRLF